jgi:serine/threonine protein kinase
VGVSYCFNPSCAKPLNPSDAKFCLACGAKLLVSERYRAVGIMGQGGFGRTLRGIDELLPSRPACAIKQFMPITWGDSTDESGDKAFDLFQQEAQRLDQLGQHPQIPRLLAHVRQDQHWYLVQEFIDGITLSQELTDVGYFSETCIWQLLADLLPILVYLQQQQVIHRDIKPDNILRRHSDQTLILVDFGAAKFATTTRLTQTGTMISSAGYTAPEQLLGRAVYASDLYSLGATCVHLLTAVPAYELYDSDEGTWCWPQKLPTPISPDLTQVLRKLLQPPLKHRYTSAAEVLADIQVLLPSPPPAQPAPPAPPPPPNASASVPTEPPWHCVRVLAEQTPMIGVGFTECRGEPPQPSDTLVTVSQTGAIKLWDLTSKQLQTALGEHAGDLQTMVLTPNQPLLICGSKRGQLSFWQLVTGQLLASVSTANQSAETMPGIQALSLSYHQQFLAIGRHRTLQLWHPQAHRPLAQTSTEAPNSILAFSPGDEWLLGGGQDGKLRVWSVPNAEDTSLTQQQRLSWQSGPIHDLAFSPDGQSLVGGGHDGYLKVWQVTRSDPLQVLHKDNQPICALRFNPQGDLLVAGFGDGTLRFWHWPTGNLLASRQEHSGAITGLSFSPNGRFLASSSQDHTVRLWRSRVTS